MSKCTNCGYELPPTAKFCDNCGTKVEVTAPPATPIQQVPQTPPTPPVQTQPQAQQPAQPTMPIQTPVQPTTPTQTPVQPPLQIPTQQSNSGSWQSAPNTQPQQNNMPTQEYSGNASTTAVKQKNLKPIIFIVIGIVALFFIGAIITLAMFFFGGSSDDPNVGVWTADEITMMGMTMDPADIYPDGIVLEITSSDKCVLIFDGDNFNAKYEIDGTTFTITQAGDEFSGTIEGNTIAITNLLDMGLDIRFVKDGATGESLESSQITEGTESSEAIVSKNDLTGKYMLSSMTTAGVVMNYDAIQQAEIEMTLEINGEEGTLIAYGTSTSVELDTSAKTMVLQGIAMDYVIEGENIVATGENAGYEMAFVFTAEGSSIWDDTSDGGVNATGFIAPGYGTEETVPVETLSNPSDWYGILTISDYVGENDISGEYEAWGHLGTDNGTPFFEVFINGHYYDENSSTFLSFYIEQHDYTFFPIVDDEAWILTAPLKEEDNTWFTPSLMNGILVGSYDYDYNGETFTFVYELAQIADSGTSPQGADSDTTDTTEATPEPTAEPTPKPAPEATPEPATTGASLSMDELRDVYLAFQDLSIDEKFSLTYDDVLTRFFNGVEGNITNQGDDFVSYQWISTESETSLLNITFRENDEGVFAYKSMSINNIDYE